MIVMVPLGSIVCIEASGGGLMLRHQICIVAKAIVAVPCDDDDDRNKDGVCVGRLEGSTGRIVFVGMP